MSNKQTLFTRIVGVVIILAGLYLLLGVMASLPLVGVIIQYWPLTLVIVGLLLMSVVPNRATSGALVALLGLMAVGNQTGLFDSEAGQATNSLLILLIGILIMVGFADSNAKK